MLITKNQLAGLAMMAGLTLAAATGCHKQSVNPVKAGKHWQADSAEVPGNRIRVLDEVDTTGIGGTGDEKDPKFPPH